MAASVAVRRLLGLACIVATVRRARAECQQIGEPCILEAASNDPCSQSSTTEGVCKEFGYNGIYCMGYSGEKNGQSCGAYGTCKCFYGTCVDHDHKICAQGHRRRLSRGGLGGGEYGDQDDDGHNSHDGQGSGNEGDADTNDVPGGSGDPHIVGLRGQHFDVAGVDGGWYCMVKNDQVDLQVNLRFTAPLPADFPHQQLITGVAVLSNGHSLVIEARNPYDVTTPGCPDSNSLCLVDGGLRAVADGQEIDELLQPSRNEPVVGGIELSASNLPVECRKFGGDRIWARMYEEMLQGRRRLADEGFEDWVVKQKEMAAPDWCVKYISERGLDHVRSKHAVFRILADSSVVIRLNVGTNQQGGGEIDWDGTFLPDLEFWQMDVGFEGLSIEHPEAMSGILGETARPVLDDNGHELMEGDGVFPGTIEDYRVDGAVSKAFPLLRENKVIPCGLDTTRRDRGEAADITGVTFTPPVYIQ